MIEVDGRPILTSVYEVVTELKMQLMLQGIDRFHAIRQSGNNLQVSCPIHVSKSTGVAGGERKPSCGISLEDRGSTKAGTVHCFSCGYVATLSEMISACFGYNDGGRYGDRWLIKNFLSVSIENRRSIGALPESRKRIVEEKQYITEEELDSYRYIHDYMYERKLTDEVIEKFDIGYDKNFISGKDDRNKDIITPCLTFPVWDKDGNCVFIARRAVKTKFFHYPQGVDKPVYGLNFIKHDTKEVIVCESIINALTCEAYGRRAIALIGTGSFPQYEVLNRSHIRKFILALDPDDAGEKATVRFKNRIHSNKVVTRFVIPKKKDINDLTLEEFNNLEEIY